MTENQPTDTTPAQKPKIDENKKSEFGPLVFFYKILKKG